MNFSVRPPSRILRSFCLSILCSLPILSVLSRAEGPLSLDEAIRRALAKNYSISIESVTPQIARADLLAAWGRFDPKLQFTYSYSEDGNPQPSDPFSGSRPPSSLVKVDSYDAGLIGQSPWGLSYRLGGSTQNRRGTFNEFADQYYSFSGLSVRQPLLRNLGLGANLVQVRLARVDKARSEWEYRNAAINTITEVIFRYNDLHFAKKILETSLRSRSLAQGLVSENERRFKVGSMSDYDVTAARARVARREEAILSAERTVRDTENLFKQLISDEHTVRLLAETIDIESPAPAPTVDVNPARDFPVALENRPDYRQAVLLAQRADLNRIYQRNQRLPQVDAVASLGYNGLDAGFSGSRRQVTDRENRSYSAGVVVEVPITFAQERGRYRAAQLTLKQAELQRAALEQTIVVDIGNAAGQIETAQKRIEAARVARELAQLTLDAELKKLRAGTSSTFVVLELQESLAEIETREFRAHSDARKAIAEYDRQLGTTLKTHRVVLE
ncbi:MAG: TolC family protein [Opitutaceae bacterium]